MNKKIIIAIIGGVVLSLFCAHAAIADKLENNNDRVGTVNYPTVPVTPVELEGLGFLRMKMQSSEGLIYRAVERENNASYSLLESMGQAMEYAALAGDAELFKYYASVTDTYFRDTSLGYYHWQVDVASKQGLPSSALVDDLRVAKAYFIAHDKKLGSYTNKLKYLSDCLLKFAINEAGYPCDYYDASVNEKAKEVSLFYLDVGTLEQLSQLDQRWQVPYLQSKIILLAVPWNQFGFYPKKFNLVTKEYVWHPNINMVENLYTALNAYKAGKDTEEFLLFLKKQIQQGQIYNIYNMDGTPQSTDESTAVYALATRFFSLHDDPEAVALCYRKALYFQIQEQPWLGGFGEDEPSLVYAFDQLEALLMLRMVENNYDG